MTRAVRITAVTVLGTVWLSASNASALERLCDPSFQNCRAAVLDLINAENVGIDVGFWFMEDARYASALIARFRAGVPVRVIMDTDGDVSARGNQAILDELKNAGIPMREKVGAGIMHWKMMLFAGQGVVEFGSANYSPDAFVPETPYQNYVDESVYETDEPSIVDSVETVFDNVWTTTDGYADYANISGPPQRSYPTSPIDPALSFPPYDDFGARLASQIAAESNGIDAIMFRITDSRVTDALIAAQQSGVPVRLIHESRAYRDPTKLWIAYNLDRLYAAGVQIRVRAHAGLTHEKLALLYGTGMTVFGSSNWTPESANLQLEHDYFTTKPYILQWFAAQFERKWTNATGNAETKPFTPLPPDVPVLQTPIAGDDGSSVELQWYGGPWAHTYDILLGTSSSNLQPVAAGVALGPSPAHDVFQSFTVSDLQPGTLYYWRIVSHTAAELTASSTIGSFRMAGTPAAPSLGSTSSTPPPSDSSPPPPPAIGPDDVVLYASHAATAGAWQIVDDASAAGGQRVWQPDAGAPKIAAASAAPSDFFELSFTAAAGVPYRLWMRGRADANSWANDSVFLQFSDSVDASGAPQFQIGSSSATVFGVEDCSGCGVSGWGWNDNYYGHTPPGTPIYFAQSGTHTIRVQSREDGVSIDQIVLSPQTWFTAAPGAGKNDATILPEQGLATGTPPPQPGTDPPPSDTPPPDGGTPSTSDDIVMHAISAAVFGAWATVADATAADGQAIVLPDLNRPKASAPLAAPTDYVELTFTAQAGVPYHLWLRGRATHDSWANDSVFVQFSGAVDASGAPVWRIGTTTGASVNLEACSGCGVSGWGWQDNGWGSPDALGEDVQFATSGPQTIRIQNREDGFVIDQVVLSPAQYIGAAPGAAKRDATILPPN